MISALFLEEPGGWPWPVMVYGNFIVVASCLVDVAPWNLSLLLVRRNLESGLTGDLQGRMWAVVGYLVAENYQLVVADGMNTQVMLDSLHTEH